MIDSEVYGENLAKESSEENINESISDEYQMRESGMRTNHIENSFNDFCKKLDGE